MLHCNMNTPTTLLLTLEDLMADLQHARRQGDLGRLALIAYCEVRRWARQAGEAEVAEHAATMITAAPHADREAFLAQVDRLLGELELARKRFEGTGAASSRAAAPAAPRAAHG